MKVERTIQMRWRLLGGCVLLLLAVLFPANASIPREAASFPVTPQFSKILSNGSQQTQTLTWDGAGRLTAVSQRDQTTNNGYDWTALYDGLGRRLRTIYTPVDGGVACTKLAVTQESWYDPEVEFLELGVSVNGQKHWKMYGPDLDGVYGGLQGIGGLEAVINQSDGVVTPVVNDAFGNAVASVTNNTVVVWNPTRVGGYGPLPGSSAQWLSTNTTLATATVWRGKRMDPTGYYWMGARYYDPVGGRFLSPDPLGHEASMDLYSYANGDPINGCDPDGRFGKNANAGLQSIEQPLIDSLKEQRAAEIEQEVQWKDSDIQWKEPTGPNYYVSPTERVMSAIFHAVPGTMQLLGAMESVSGQNPLTLEPVDRSEAALGMMLSVMPIGAMGGTVERGVVGMTSRAMAGTELKGLTRTIARRQADTLRRFVRQEEFARIQQAIANGDRNVRIGTFFTPDKISDANVATSMLAIPGTRNNPIVGFVDVPASVLPSGPMRRFGPRQVLPFRGKDGVQLPGLGIEVEFPQNPVVPTGSIRLTPLSGY